MENPKATCPNCREPIKRHWTVCPVCEAILVELVCPYCNKSIKENWKICPECNTRLKCPICGLRIPKGDTQCQGCKPSSQKNFVKESTIIEPVTLMAFLYIPGGTFLMGDSFGDGIDNELPAHEVSIDPFYMGKYPVTQGQWNFIMKNNPSKFQKGDDYPVEQITFFDVQRFIENLAKQNNQKYNFRLPTEAQWEYAARSGGKNNKYAGENESDKVAWYNENSHDSTHPVGKKLPNGLGLYDMSGNVWEWCQDVYKPDSYEYHEKKNPICRDGSDDRVIRGGSFSQDFWSIRCARRFGFSPDNFGPGLGFRLIIECHK